MKIVLPSTISLNKNFLKNMKISYPKYITKTICKYFSSNESNKENKQISKLPKNNIENILSNISSKAVMKDDMQGMLTNNKKIFIELEERSVHLQLLNYIERLNLDDPDVTNKKGKLIEIMNEKDKFYCINIMGIMKFKIEQNILSSICKNLQQYSRNSFLKIYFDGGCANKERLGSFGCSFYVKNLNLFQIAGNIGPKNTNNTSEYFGLLVSLIFLDLMKIKDLQIPKVKIFSDSELVCRQIQGKYKINTPHMIILNSISKNILKRIETKVEIFHVLREFNEEADNLANIGKTFENNCFVVNY